MVYCSTVPAQGQFHRQIGMESCYRFGLYVYQHEAYQFMFAGISVWCLISSGSYIYQHEAYHDNILSRDLEH
jgi:hypothetical protein